MSKQCLIIEEHGFKYENKQVYVDGGGTIVARTPKKATSTNGRQPKPKETQARTREWQRGGYGRFGQGRELELGREILSADSCENFC